MLNLYSGIGGHLQIINFEDMMEESKKERLKARIELQKQYETETGKKWWTNPVCHGEMGFASWEYQIWLEQKLIANRHQVLVIARKKF